MKTGGGLVRRSVLSIYYPPKRVARQLDARGSHPDHYRCCVLARSKALRIGHDGFV